MLRRRDSYSAAIRNGLPDDYDFWEADYLASSLPLNDGIYPIFQIIVIPIHRNIPPRHFQSLVVVMERYDTHRPIARLHYLYSTESQEGLSARQGLHTAEVLDPSTTAYVMGKTQFLTGTEINNFKAWGRAYPCFVPPAGTHHEFWHKFYGRFEAYHEQMTVSDPTFQPIDLASDRLELNFRPPSPTASMCTTQPTLTMPSIGGEFHPDDFASAALVPLGRAGFAHEVTSGCYVLENVANVGYRSAAMAEHIGWGISGDPAVLQVRGTPEGVTAAIFGVLGVTFECIDLFNRLREKRFKEAETWVEAALISTQVIGGACWAASNLVAASSAGAASAGVMLIYSIGYTYGIRKTPRAMAECLAKLEAYYRQQTSDVLQDWTSSTLKREVESGTYQHRAGFFSLYVMVAWLTRKYRRCLATSIPFIVKEIPQLGLAIGAAVALSAGSVATFGIVGAIGLGLGIFYLSVAGGRAIIGNRNNAAILKAYQASVEDLYTRRQIPEVEYQQEQTLFQLADKVHPIRHRAFGTTIGDYMRVKIASFVILTKRAVTEAPHLFGPEHPEMDIVKVCADIMGDAIHYTEAHGKFTTPLELRARILRLGGSIPFRGY
ncbi:MAG: hypothetical protein A3J38_09705 [Gammaproteobacteria bacterium RIFCSPHIGHO2_12_FULL_45_9]|nr:MAG: hypothetical protein A3J38_09705 [Gammaproteobacteria bacterium RIFCSPHIGHO2_12_FULL_45_9]